MFAFLLIPSHSPIFATNTVRIAMFEILRAVPMKIQFFWGVTPYRLVNSHRHLGRVGCFHLQWPSSLIRIVSLQLRNTGQIATYSILILWSSDESSGIA